MEDLLLRLLFIDTENTIMAALFLCYCVHIPRRTFLELLGVLQQPGKIKVLRPHSRIMEVFHLVHSHCLAISEEERGVLMEDFLRHVAGRQSEIGISSQGR